MAENGVKLEQGGTADYMVIIENTSNKHIVISAQSSKYEQLAYFKALLKSKNVLDSVVSTEATKEGDTIKITIEGDVPWKIF